MNFRQGTLTFGISLWVFAGTVFASDRPAEGKEVHACVSTICEETMGDMDLKLDGPTPFVLEITREKVNRVSPFKRPWPDACHYEIIFPKQWAVFSESPGNVWQSVISGVRSNFIRSLRVGLSRSYFVKNVMSESFVHSYIYQNAANNYRFESLQAKVVIREVIPGFSYVHLKGICPEPIKGSNVTIYLPKEGAYPNEDARNTRRPNLDNFSELQFPKEVVKVFYSD